MTADAHNYDCTKMDADGTLLSPLHAAVEAGDLVRLQVLVGAGADIEEIHVSADGRRMPPLYRAAKNGHKILALYLVEHGANKEADVNNCGGTALHVAVEGLHIEVVRMLIEHGAKKDVIDNKRQTPLIWATYGQVAMVEYLLEQGCDVDRADMFGPCSAPLSPGRLNSAALSRCRSSRPPP